MAIVIIDHNSLCISHFLTSLREQPEITSAFAQAILRPTQSEFFRPSRRIWLFDNVAVLTLFIKRSLCAVGLEKFQIVELINYPPEQ